MKFKRAYIKEDFSRTTEQGYEVVEIATSRSGRKYAIIHRPKTDDYLIAAGYNTNRGDWDQGYYDYRTKGEAMNALEKAMEKAGDTFGKFVKEGMKDTLDKMIGKKEEALTEDVEHNLARKAVELSNVIFTFLEIYYTKENDSVITPEDKTALLKARSAFDDIAKRAQMRDKTTVDDVEDIERVDTRKMSIIRGDDDIGVDEYDIVRK